MVRRVFFSFKYEDVSRARVVRDRWVTDTRKASGFIDAENYEKIKQLGDDAIRAWIDGQLLGTCVTVVLVGELTCTSRWVKYEIDESIKRGNGLLGINISKIKNLQGEISICCGRMPKGYPFYLWNKNEGFKNIGNWIGAAAQAAGRDWAIHD